MIRLFSGTNAWSARADLGFQFPINSRVTIGLSPLCFEVLTSRPIGIMTTNEPRAWFGLSLRGMARVKYFASPPGIFQ